ncbi:hypothetical protein M569_11468, partial [Genlisea aurea]
RDFWGIFGFSSSRVMPFSPPGALDFDSKGLTLFRTWRNYVFGQIAVGMGFHLSRKFLIGDSSSLEIFFWFPSSIVLNKKFFPVDYFMWINSCSPAKRTSNLMRFCLAA